jgi:hypothetical protein
VACVRNPLVHFAVVVLGALLLIGGVFFGLSPLKAQVTTLVPPNTQVEAPCGFHYLPAVPALPDADPVPLPSDRKVQIARAEYTARCAEVTGWQPYVAWALTAVGLLGFVVLVIARRQGIAGDDDQGPQPNAPRSNPLWR